MLRRPMNEWMDWSGGGGSTTWVRRGRAATMRAPNCLLASTGLFAIRNTSSWMCKACRSSIDYQTDRRAAVGGEVVFVDGVVVRVSKWRFANNVIPISHWPTAIARAVWRRLRRQSHCRYFLHDIEHATHAKQFDDRLRTTCEQIEAEKREHTDE